MNVALDSPVLALVELALLASQRTVHPTAHPQDSVTHVRQAALW